MALLALPHAAASAMQARRTMVRELSSLGVPPEVVADAELLMAEMVGNAVRHAVPLPDGNLRAGWEVSDGHVVLRVTDGGGPTLPAVPAVPSTGECGRGLAIVEALADEWGAEPCNPGLRTWAVIDLTAAEQGRR